MWEVSKCVNLSQRRKSLLAGGGIDKVNRQHSSGKMTARERIENLLDTNTFIEVNGFMESRATDFGMQNKSIVGDGVITGYGEINGRTTFVSVQDFTVLGGSLGEIHAEKICHIIDMALSVQAPIIFINDSGGARIEEGIVGLNGYGNIFYRNTIASGIIPQISVIMGPCAGGACYSPAICDFIFMTEKNSQMYITGPQVVKAVTGENITSDELGGSGIHSSKSGVNHFVFSDEKSCLNGVRELLAYLPQNNNEHPAIIQPVENYGSVNLQNIVPDNSRKIYDVHSVINEIVDSSSFTEVQSGFAKNIVIGFSRIDGQSMGIVANQPNNLGGSIDYNASDKAARFVRFCDCFNIPILSLVDVPAFMPGSIQEHNGIIRHGAKLLYAFAEATVPKVCLIMRKAFGGAYIAMNSKSIGADIVFAWPIAEIAVMGADGAVNIIGRREIEASKDRDDERRRLVTNYNEKFMTPYIAASRGFIDEVILPEETRERIVSAFKMLRNKSKKTLNRKHGNIPL